MIVAVLLTTVQTDGCRQITQIAHKVVVFLSILTVWWVENRQYSHGIERNNLPIWKRLRDLRATSASKSLIFYHGPSIITEKGPKWTKIFLNREQKNTYSSSFFGGVCLFNSVEVLSFQHLMLLDANRLSRKVSIHASLKEIAFKLTFRWNRHWVQGGEERILKNELIKIFFHAFKQK